MRLLNPWGLAWLGAMVPILLLYLLRLRRQEVTVASVLFWSRAVEDLHANAPFQKLRRNLLLYLQLLVVLLGALIAARPYRQTTALGGQTVAAVLDGSASMTAPLGNGTRFDRAREEVAQLVSHLGRGDRLMLVLATDRAEVLCPLTNDRRLLARALGQARPVDSGTNLRDALALAVSVVRGQADPRVYLFSDGALPPIEATGLNTAEVRLVPIGEPADNVGITALDARRPFGDRARLEVLLALTATGPTRDAREVEVEFRVDDRLFDVRRYRVQPGQPEIVVLDDLPSEAGLLEVRLTQHDALEADNRAYVSLGSARRTEVRIAGDGGLFLNQALSIDPTIRVVKTSVGAIQQAALEGRLEPDTVVCYAGLGPSREVPAPSLYLDCAGAGAPVTLTGEVETPVLLDWSREHPVTRHVDFGEVAVGRARTAKLKPWATALLDGPGTPLLAAGEQHGVRKVYVGFDLLNSDFPLRAGFPIFIANTVRWLTGGRVGGVTPTGRCGEPLRVDLATAETTAKVTLPDGSTRAAEVVAGRVALPETRQVGLYQVRAGDRSVTVAESLLSADESELTPRGELRVGQVTIRPPTHDRQRPSEQWRWLAVVMLLVLTIEWWWFHQRG